jgi:dTMP kinase
MPVSAETGIGRLKSHDRLEAEPLAFHERVRQEFLQIARLDPERYLVVDGTQTIEQIQNEIINRVVTIPAISHIVKEPKLKKTIKTTIKKPIKKSAKKK